MGNKAERKGTSVHMLVWNDFCGDARVLKKAQTLQAAGYHVVVHAVHVPGKTCRQEFLADGVEVRRVSLSPFGKSAGNSVSGARKMPLVLQILSRLWAHLLMLGRLICTQAEVIHAHDVNTLPTAWLAARLSGAKIVYDAHEISTSREGYSSFRNLVAGVERFPMRERSSLSVPTA
jgi:hypothetical protein